MEPNTPITPLELLQQTHAFPGPYMVKAIGNSHNDFAARIVAAVSAELGVELDHEVRETPGGRHVSVTLHVRVESAEQVLAIHHRLKKVDGLVMLL